MAIPNTFTSGVNTSFSSELNENFTYLDKKGASITIGSGSGSTASTSFQDAVTITTPAALKDSQTVLIEMYSRVIGGSGGSIEYQLYDNTDAAQITLGSWSSSSDWAAGNLQGTVTITTATNTKSIKVRFRSAVSGGVAIQDVILKATLIE